MPSAWIIRGHFDGQQFVASEPLPSCAGPAEMIVFPPAPNEPAARPGSIFDLFGQAPQLRSGAAIAEQIHAEHAAWGEP